MKRGFTLIELLIGMTICAVIATAVYTSMYLSITMWRRHAVLSEQFQAAQICLAEIRRSLRCTFLNPQNEQIDFSGTEQSIAFFALSPQGDIEQVRFYSVPEPAAGGLSLRCTRAVYTPQQSEEAAAVPEQVMAYNLAELSFAYFSRKENRWYQEWKPQTTAPDMVTCTIAFRKSPADASAVSLERVIAIPIAVFAAPGETNEAS